MKIGKMEGSPEEIRNFFQDNGLKNKDILEKQKPGLKIVWLIIPSFSYIATLFYLTVFSLNFPNMFNFVFSIGMAAGLWMAVWVQIRFKSTSAAIFLAIGIILIMLLSIGTVTPIELLQYIKEIKKGS